MKRKAIISAILVLAMLLTCSLSAFAEDYGIYFTTSKYRTYANYSVQSAPEYCDTVYAGQQLYLDMAGTTAHKFSKVVFSVQLPNTGYYTTVFSWSSKTGYCRWECVPYTFTNVGDYQVKVDIYPKGADYSYYGIITVHVLENTSSSTTGSSVSDALAEMQQQYPAGSHWYGSFDGSTQCSGWARMIFYNVHGYEYWVNNPNGKVAKMTDSNYIYNGLKVGDLVRYKNNGHSVIITGFGNDGDTVYVCDCNSDYNGIIRWGQPMSRATLAKTFTHAYTIAY